jgi:hypothetical protein
MAEVVDPIYIGQDVQTRMTTVDGSGSPANPSSVRFHVKKPSGVITIYNTGDPNVTELVVGQTYGCTFDLDQTGKWNVRCEALNGSSVVVGVDQFSFWVNQTNL